MDRREFLRKGALGAATLGTAACKSKVDKIKTAVGGNEAVPSGRMPLRFNHNSGDHVSLLGYGCMRWPMIKDENGNDVIDQEAVNELVDKAIEHGVNYFDSAPVYLQGKSEEATAKALLRHPRESYYIATKLSNFGPRTLEGGIEMYRKSLKFYQTKYIDYYLLHSISDADAFNKRYVENGLMDFLLSERKYGRIRNLGFSFHGTTEGFDSLMALHETYHWDFVQIQMNYIDWKHAGGRNCNAEYLYEKLAEYNIPVVIMEPLLGGRLSNIPEPAAVLLKEKEPQMSVASWAFRFNGSFPNILTILSGMTYMEHLEDNIRTFEDFKPLKEEEFELLESVSGLIKDYPLVGCTACNYCMPCPYGIDIPGIFTHYNRAVNDGLTVETDPESREYKKNRRKYLTSYSKSIETIRQADHCIACGICTDHCPQNIRIPRELRRIDSYIERLKQGE